MPGSDALPVIAARDAFTRAAGVGKLCLPVCTHCGAVQYPPRDTCHECLSANLQVREVGSDGSVVAATVLHRSNEPRFLPLLPLRIASIRLDAGPLVIAFLPGDADCDRVRVALGLDTAGLPVLRAEPLVQGDRH